MTALDDELDRLRSIPLPDRPSVESLARRVDRRRQRRRIRVAGSGLVAIVLALTGTAVLMAEDDHERVATEDSEQPAATTPTVASGAVEVPDVVGLTLAAATEVMRDAGLVFSVIDRDAPFARAVVLATEPGAESHVAPGAVVGARTALPDPPVDVECPDSRHPRGEASADALPSGDGLGRSAAEAEVRAMRAEIPNSSDTEIFIGIWDRWAYIETEAGVAVEPTRGYQVVVANQGSGRCPSAPQFRSVPVTYVDGPVEVWAGDPLATSGEPQTAVWVLGADGLPAADSSSFTALVSRLACSGGTTGDVLDPSIEVNADEVVVTFTVAPLPEGAYTCPGNRAVPYVVVLGEPLGARTLVDGACRSSEAASTSFCGSEAGGGQRWPRTGQ